MGINPFPNSDFSCLVFCDCTSNHNTGSTTLGEEYLRFFKMDEFQDLSRTKLVSIGNYPQVSASSSRVFHHTWWPTTSSMVQGAPDVLRGPQGHGAGHERFGNACYFFLFEHTSIFIVWNHGIFFYCLKIFWPFFNIALKSKRIIPCNNPPKFQQGKLLTPRRNGTERPPLSVARYVTRYSPTAEVSRGSGRFWKPVKRSMGSLGLPLIHLKTCLL